MYNTVNYVIPEYFYFLYSFSYRPLMKLFLLYTFQKKPANPNALNVRRNIREVMDEKNLDASTLTAQRQESERLARVQEQQRIIREVKNFS